MKKLEFNITNIADHEKLKVTRTDPATGKNQTALSAITDALVRAAVDIGINKITPSTVGVFFRRTTMVEMVAGPYVYELAPSVCQQPADGEEDLLCAGLFIRNDENEWECETCGQTAPRVKLPRPITLVDVLRHVGLETNAKLKTDKTLGHQLVKILEARAIIRHKEQRKAATPNENDDLVLLDPKDAALLRQTLGRCRSGEGER